MIELCIENNAKLSVEQANCYRSSFYAVREMLRVADSEYIHERIVEFYQEGRELSNEWDRLKWITPAEEKAAADAISNETPF